jgi:hypothetical protein
MCSEMVAYSSPRTGLTFLRSFYICYTLIQHECTRTHTVRVRAVVLCTPYTLCCFIITNNIYANYTEDICHTLDCRQVEVPYTFCSWLALVQLHVYFDLEDSE